MHNKVYYMDNGFMTITNIGLLCIQTLQMKLTFNPIPPLVLDGNAYYWVDT